MRYHLADFLVGSLTAPFSPRPRDAPRKHDTAEHRNAIMWGLKVAGGVVNLSSSACLDQLGSEPARDASGNDSRPTRV